MPFGFADVSGTGAGYVPVFTVTVRQPIDIGDRLASALRVTFE